MDQLKNFLFGGYSTYVQKRRSQIEREEKIDLRLSSLPCTHFVSSYLLMLRSNNRARTREYSDCSFTNCLDLLDKHLQQTDNELNYLEIVLASENPCEI